MQVDADTALETISVYVPAKLDDEVGHCAIRLFICDVVSMCVFQAVEHWDIARVLDRLDVDAAWGYVKTCKRYAGVLTDELAVSGWTCVLVSVLSII